jgi:hypothetical protein
MSVALVLRNRTHISEKRIEAPETSGEMIIATLWLLFYLLMALRHLW